ncbi:MAG: hypothetical protein QOG04_672 [Actinomycetota bacterium]|jgi:hypothetical protein|nr:hypothetical protein [Actinomycetota bacterium]
MSAAGADVGDEPRTSGPLVSIPSDCNPDSGDPEQTVFRTCSWSYTMLPAETDAQEDFSALWLQLEVDPGEGTCLRELRVILKAPSDGRIVSGAPAESGRIDKAAAAVTELSVDGGGTAPVPGTVAQDVDLVPGQVSVNVNDKQYRYVWRGKTKNKMMVAVGVQMAHRAVPPALTYSIGGVVGASMDSCHPVVITIRG